MENNLGFKKKELFNEYIGQYIILFPSTGGNTFSGKLIGIEEDYAVLKPHQGGEYDKNKGVVRKLVDKPSKVRISDITAVEPTTRESLENFCEYENLREQKLQEQLKNHNKK